MVEQKQSELSFEMWIQNSYSVKWESQYFDLKEEKDVVQYGEMPFSLETYLELYRDPRKHKFVLLPKPKAQPLIELISQPHIGRLVVRSSFTSNPFLFPIRAETDIEKNVYVITLTPNAENASD